MKGLIIGAFVALSTLTFATTVNANMLSTAKQYVGLNEDKHTGKITRLIGANPRSVRWCGLFVKAIAKKNGKRLPSNPASSQSWKTVGSKVSKPRPGDLMILPSHVTIFSRYKNGRICGVGGNQSDGVKESCYASRRITFRRL